MSSITTLAASIAGWLFAITGAIAADGHSFALEVLWSTPIAASSVPPGTRYNPPPEPDLMFDVQAMHPDGRITFLGSRVSAGKRVSVLFTDPERNPSENGIVLPLKGAHPRNLHLLSGGSGSSPYLLALAAGASGEIWVGGALIRTWTWFRPTTATAISQRSMLRERYFGKQLMGMADGDRF